MPSNANANTNAQTQFEISKTHQYRKVMKPLLERKRRARINKCLDELKDLMADCVQQYSEEPSAKIEKAHILELTVLHLRKLNEQRQQKQQVSNIDAQQSFRSGYIQAANEVSRCLATLPKVDVGLGTKLMTHLGLRLNQLESNDASASRTAINAPLSINCPGSSTNTAMLYSPVSSGYASDTEYARSSPALSATSSSSSSSMSSSSSRSSQGLLQMATPVWRPW